MNGSAVFETAFRRAEQGRPATFTLRDTDGGVHLFEPATWCRDELLGDAALIEPCTGPTLDVGCGPGRLTAALARTGHPALGIDVSAAAVRLARRRGAVALRRDVFGPLPEAQDVFGLLPEARGAFGPLPEAGRWRHLLLADGNIGIGGDPGRLLRRCGQLVAADGQVHVELSRPGTTSWAGTAIVHNGSGPGTAMSWAQVAVDDIAPLAASASMRVLDTRTEAGRWFTTLTPR